MMMMRGRGTERRRKLVCGDLDVSQVLTSPPPASPAQPWEGPQDHRCSRVLSEPPATTCLYSQPPLTRDLTVHRGLAYLQQLILLIISREVRRMDRPHRALETRAPSWVVTCSRSPDTPLGAPVHPLGLCQKVLSWTSRVQGHSSGAQFRGMALLSPPFLGGVTMDKPAPPTAPRATLVLDCLYSVRSVH